MKKTDTQEGSRKDAKGTLRLLCVVASLREPRLAPSLRALWFLCIAVLCAGLLLQAYPAAAGRVPLAAAGYSGMRSFVMEGGVPFSLLETYYDRFAQRPAP